MAVGWADRIRVAVTENLNLKLLSFGFALVLYSMVHGGQDAQTTVSVDLDVLVPPESANRTLVNKSKESVKLTVRGSRAAIEELHARDVGAIQLDAHTGNEKRVSIDPASIRLPPGVRVEQIDPPAIDLTWEDRVERDVPIQVSVVGTPAPGYMVKGAPKSEPRDVRVKGPKSAVMTLQYARAEAFDVSGLGEGIVSKQLAIDKPQPELSYDTASVKVTLEITREIVERPFTKLAVAVVGPPKGKTQPAEVDVRLVCPPEVLRALRPEQVVPRVEVQSHEPTGSMTLPVEVSVDKCDAHVTPSTVVVRW
jgi:YbbR domain-containing protein